MGSQGRNTQVNAQKYIHGTQVPRAIVGHKVQRVFWDKTAKGPDYQEAGCYSVLTGEQPKKGLTCSG